MLDAHPVEGFYRRLRWWVDGLLILVLLAPPWIEIAGEPLLRLDIPGRNFHVFGAVFFPQELLFLWLIVALLTLALFLFTALAGRLWCGWACPQTVFTDVFAAIARRVQGWGRTGPPDSIARWRVALTQVLWMGVSIAVGFHLVAYFQSPYHMGTALLRGEATGVTLGCLVVASVFVYLDIGFVRQIACTYLCPYARLQGVLFDSETLVIGYDESRGEPRGKRGQVAGDCVDCSLCVTACPVQIDIRDGLQLECIACTQCIDACDGVMARIGRPRGLIDYFSLDRTAGSGASRLLRPRVLVYSVLLLAVVGTLTITLSRRVPIGLSVARGRAALYQRTPDGRVGNAYTLLIQNRDRVGHRYRIALDAPRDFELIAGVNPIALAPTSTLETRVFVLRESERLTGVPQLETFRFVLSCVDDPGHRAEHVATFVQPPVGWGMGGWGRTGGG